MKMEDYTKQAKRALRERDFERAGDLYFMAKDFKKALKMYLKAENYELAAKVCEETRDFENAIFYHEQLGNYEKAAELAQQIEKYTKAIELYERAENYFKAAYIAEGIQDFVRAGEIYTKFSDYTKAAKCFIQGNEYNRALELIKILINQRKHVIEQNNISEAIDNIIKSYKTKAAELLEKMDRYLEAAEYLLETEDFDSAAEMFSRASKPQRAFEIYLERGFHEKALEEYIKNKSNIETDEKTLAELYESSGNTLSAAEQYEKVNMLAEAADAYKRAGNIDKAAEVYVKDRNYKEAVELYLSHGNFIEAVLVLEKFGRYKEAANLAETKELWKKAAELYARSNSQEKAAQMYEKYGNYQEAAKIYIELNEKPKAIRLYESSPKSFDSPDIIRAIQIELGQFIEAANLSMTMNDINKAADLFKMAKKFPEAAELYASIEKHEDAAQMYLSSHEIQKAAHYFEKAGNHKMAGDCYLNLMRYHKAADCYLTAHEYILAAQVYYNLKDMDRTVNVLQKIKPSHTEYFNAAFQLGKIFHSRQFFNLAKIKLEESIQDEAINSENIENFYLLADSYTHMGMYAEAINLFDKILSFDFNYRDALKLREKAQNHKDDRMPIGQKIDETVHFVDLLKLKEGDMIAKRFKILGELGHGGMGKVYKAFDTELEEIIAVKILFTQFGDYEEEKKHLVNEIKIARRITHPYIIKVFDIGDWLGNKFFTMQYVEGKDLNSWLAENAGLDYQQKMLVIRKICEGLQAAHNMQVIHRDIKPKNIMITDKANPIILDFGIAEAVNAYLKSSRGQLVGSPNYMSPEQISDKDYDHRTDIYSLGCVMYEMFTRRRPYVEKDLTELFMAKLDHDPRPPGEINPDLPPDLEKIITRCMSKNPSFRYNNMKEIISDINLFLAMKGTKA